MEDSPARDRMISDFDAIIGKLGGSGASERLRKQLLKNSRRAISRSRAI